MMADEQQQAEFEVTIRADYALWPGDGVFCIRYHAVELDADGAPVIAFAFSRRDRRRPR